MITKMKVLYNADDYGLNEEVNEAISYCFANELIQRTTIIVNSKYTEQAVKLAKEKGFIKNVGLHINLIEGEPLSETIKLTELCDEYGKLSGDFFHTLKHRLFLTPIEKKAVKEEIDAQIEQFIKHGCTTMHMDSHQHTHNNLSILFIFLREAKKYNIKTVRLARNIPRSQINVLKKIYKTGVNTIIKLYNHNNSGSSCQFFGSKNDYEIEMKTLKGVSGNRHVVLEIMVHPILFNNKVYDSVNNVLLFG